MINTNNLIWRRPTPVNTFSLPIQQRAEEFPHYLLDGIEFVRDCSSSSMGSDITLELETAVKEFKGEYIVSDNDDEPYDEYH